MHMRIDEAGRDQVAAVIGDSRRRMGCFQAVGSTQGQNAALIHQHATMGDMAGGRQTLGEGIAGEGQDLSQDQIGHDAPMCAGLCKPDQTRTL
jgi:hypothetical protein